MSRQLQKMEDDMEVNVPKKKLNEKHLNTLTLST